MLATFSGQCYSHCPPLYVCQTLAHKPQTPAGAGPALGPDGPSRQAPSPTLVGGMANPGGTRTTWACDVGLLLAAALFGVVLTALPVTHNTQSVMSKTNNDGISVAFSKLSG